MIVWGYHRFEIQLNKIPARKNDNLPACDDTGLSLKEDMVAMRCQLIMYNIGFDCLFDLICIFPKNTN